MTACLGLLMLLVDIATVNVALPSIASDLSASFSDLQWTIDAYALSPAAVLLVTGSLGLLRDQSRVGPACDSLLPLFPAEVLLPSQGVSGWEPQSA